MTHSPAPIFIGDTAGGGNTNQMSVASLQPLESCGWNSWLAYVYRRSDTIRAGKNLSLFLRLRFLSLQIGFNCTIVTCQRISWYWLLSCIHLGWWLQVFKLFYCIQLMTIDCNWCPHNDTYTKLIPKRNRKLSSKLYQCRVYHCA